MTAVLIEEARGKTWFWEPKMSEDEFLKWWGDLESIAPLFDKQKDKLPGQCREVVPSDEMLDEWVVFLHPSGGARADLDLPENVFSCFIDSDSNSYIRGQDGEYHYHRGA